MNIPEQRPSVGYTLLLQSLQVPAHITSLILPFWIFVCNGFLLLHEIWNWLLPADFVKLESDCRHSIIAWFSFFVDHIQVCVNVRDHKLKLKYDPSKFWADWHHILLIIMGHLLLWGVSFSRNYSCFAHSVEHFLKLQSLLHASCLCTTPPRLSHSTVANTKQVPCIERKKSKTARSFRKCNTSSFYKYIHV